MTAPAALLVHLPPDLRAALAALAAREDRSLAAVVREGIRMVIADRERRDPRRFKPPPAGADVPAGGAIMP